MVDNLYNIQCQEDDHLYDPKAVTHIRRQDKDSMMIDHEVGNRLSISSYTPDKSRKSEIVPLSPIFDSNVST